MCLDLCLDSKHYFESVRGLFTFSYLCFNNRNCNDLIMYSIGDVVGSGVWYKVAGHIINMLAYRLGLHMI